MSGRQLKVCCRSNYVKMNIFLNTEHDDLEGQAVLGERIKTKMGDAVANACENVKLLELMMFSFTETNVGMARIAVREFSDGVSEHD